METIYRYPLTPCTTLDLPRAAQPLTVYLQYGEPMLWVKLDPTAPTIPRYFRWFGTADAIATVGTLTYIATFQMENGLVFHVFEEHG